MWLIASVMHGAPKSQLLHAATVEEDQKGEFLRYIFDNPKMNLSRTSGAPILNSDGEVVAINVAADTTRGKLVGLGTPVTRFRPYLEAAVKREQPFAR